MEKYIFDEEKRIMVRTARRLFFPLPDSTGSRGMIYRYLADLSAFPSLICGSCPSGQGFAFSFLQDFTSR